MKDHWMAGLYMKDFSSLEELRESLMNYVNSYNKSVHSSLNGMTPQDRFFLESILIKRISDEDIHTGFLLEYERRVSSDNVIVIDDIEYEVPYRYAKQRIKLRYSPDFETVYVVDASTGELEPVKLLNKHDNSHIKREKIRLTGGIE